MQDLETFYIPKTLDAPEKFIFFTMTELVVFIFPFMTGVTFGFTMTGLIFGLLGVFITKKILSTGVSINRLLYWYTVPNMFIGTRKPKFAPPSSVRILR